MKLNREQIIKALECCASEGCETCPYSRMPTLANCVLFTMGNALALIKELTEDVERVAKQCAEIIVECDERDAERLKEVADLKAIAEQYQKQFEDCYEENERLTTSCTELEQVCKKWQGRLNIECEYTRADTVRKMQDAFAVHFGTYTDKDTVKVLDVFRLLDQIAKEMSEGANND